MARLRLGAAEAGNTPMKNPIARELRTAMRLVII
jgi:hypothetical protein